MLDFISPTIYAPTTSLSGQISFDEYDFGKLLVFGSKESIILNYFELLGGKIIDRNNIEIFLKENSFVVDSIVPAVNNLKDFFNNINIKLETYQMNGEKSELFLIIETKSEPEEVLESLKRFDEWFVPNIFKKFTRFNVNVNFV